MEGKCLLMFPERGRIFCSRTAKFDEIPQLVFKDLTYYKVVLAWQHRGLLCLGIIGY